MGSTGFGVQANALLRKSATYQKRNVRTNICLLSSPIFFCLLLLIIKLLVDNIFLTGEDFECGCQCTRCCKDGVCVSLSQGFCDEDRGYKCEEFDKSKCSLLYSSPGQANWCEVRDPSSWPAVLQTPRSWRRALPARPGVTILTASPNAPPSYDISNLTPYIVPTPYIDNATLLALLPQLVEEDGSINGYLLSKYGFAFGSASDTGANQYIEASFSGEALLDFLVPNIRPDLNCAALGWTNTSTPLPLALMIAMAVNYTTNTLVTPEQMVAALAGRPVLGDFLMQPTVCTDVVMDDTANFQDVNRALYCGYSQARCNGTVAQNEYPPTPGFPAASSSGLSLYVYWNGTDQGQGGTNVYERVQSTLSGGVMAWWTNVVTSLAGANVTSLLGSERLLGIMSMPKAASKLRLDFSNLLGPLFYTWVVQMLMPTFLQQLVYEKEKRLRMMMKMHGLGDGAYWFITYLWYLLLYVVYMIIFIAFGAGVGLESFRRTNMGIQVIFYFLFGNCMIAFCFMLSSFFASSRTSTAVAFIYVFATGLIGELMLKVFMEKDATWVFFIEWIPAFALYRGLWEMAEYAFLGVYRNEAGLTWERLRDPGCGMRATWGIFAVEWAVFLVLGWYLEQVLSSGTGIRRHPLFFLECCGLGGRKKAQPAGSGSDSGSGTFTPPRASIEMGNTAYDETAGGKGGSGALKLSPDEREDVRAERLRVEALIKTGDTSSSSIVVRDLRKVFPPQDGGKPKVAVRTLTLGIERGECFGLLGPNGAGKSTSINMLTGFLEPSKGTAMIEGLDIRKDMTEIYRLMGVCPQHDLLWEQLTGEEHLYFYGRLKGLKGPELSAAVTAALKSVNLFNNKVGQKQAQKYSGGMKRRLSVAISFIGEPKVVYLDEPSTGLDPASRRALWDVVRANKSSRAIILTTHSMEEAEQLCDRLGIFVDGQLVCIGNPREITSRYAGYLVFTLTVGNGHEEAAQAFVARMSPNARLTYALGGTFKYELPASDVSLSGVFDAMAGAKGLMQVLDWGVANATLEEVFIKFARQIGAETKDD